jgi:hypothetical protein
MYLIWDPHGAHTVRRCLAQQHMAVSNRMCPTAASLPPQGRNIDRVFTVTYLPITLCLIGVVSLWPRLVWSGPGRITAGYCLFTLCCAAVPVVSAVGL